MVNAQFAPRTTRKAPSNPLVNHYVTRDQKRFLTCLLDPKKDWRNLCCALEHPELVDDPRFLTPELRRANSAELVAIIDAIVGSRDMAEWVEIFRRCDVIWAPVLSTAEVAHDPQLAANGVFAELAPGLRTVNSPLNVTGVKKVKPTMAPQIGEHTLEVLQSIGYSAEAVDDLLQRGAAMATNPTAAAKARL
jgi:formyl-CoA transferase